MPIQQVLDVRARWILFPMAFFAFFILSAQRINMSIAMVDMVNWKTIEINRSLICHVSGNKSHKENGKFTWSIHLQSQILASFLYGLTVAYIPAELMADRFSPLWLVFVGMTISSACTFLSPLAANTDVYYLVYLQVVKAIGQSLVSPAFSMMMCALVPSQQLVRYAAFTTTGIHTGAFITYGTAGIICSTDFLGWEYVFYISGVSGAVWCIFWFYLQWDHNFKSAFKIPIFIQEDVKKHKKLPIASILKSYPVWAYIAVGVASYWSYSFNILMLPMYFRTAFEIEAEWNGLASSYPNLLQAFTFLLSSLMSDRLLERKVVRKISVRKFCVATGLSLAATFMVLLTFILCSRALSTLVMVFALGSLGPTLTALINIPVDLSPRYSGILSGIMNTLGALTGSFLPFMVGYFSKSSDGMELWGKVFYATCFISFIAVIIFLAYGSAQIQPWNNLVDSNLSNVPNESESLEAVPPANWSDESLLSSLPEQPLKKEERSTSKIPENIFKAGNEFGNVKKY